MPKIDELLRRTNRIVDDKFDNIDLIDWFNQCQNQALSELLYLPKEETLAKSGDGFPLSPDYKNGLEITNTNVENYEIFAGIITVDNDDVESLTIRYNRVPTKLENNPDQVPDIPEEFHDTYIFYGAMMAMLSDEEHARQDRFEREFIKVSSRLKSYMDKKRSKISNTTQWVVNR